MEELELNPETPVEELAPEVVAPEVVSTEAVSPEVVSPEAVSMETLLPRDAAPAIPEMADTQLLALLEAVVYVADEPLTLAQIAAGLAQPVERVETILRQLTVEFDKPEHGIAIREVAGGFKIATKPEHHETVRNFVKSLKAPLKLSLPALETLAVIAYKQPVTAPEVMEIRGVQGAGVFKTLLERKLIAGAGRKNVIGKPMLYKTTKEFLIQFGLNDLAELPSLKEFEEIRRMAFPEIEPATAETVPVEAAHTEVAQPESAQPEAAAQAEAPQAEPAPEPAPSDAPAVEPEA